MKAKFENSDGSIFEVDGLPDGVFTAAPAAAPAPAPAPAPSPSPSPSPNGAATVSGTFADGSTFSVNVPAGTRQHIVAGDDSKGSIWHTNDGAVLIENCYATSPGDLSLSGVAVTAPDGTQLFSGDLTIWQSARTRPFWYVQPTRLASPDLSMLGEIAPNATASLYTKYSASDNSPMGAGLNPPGIGSGGDRAGLGEPFPEWDAILRAQITVGSVNANDEEVALGMSDSIAVWPFHAIDPATELPLDVSAYPKASFASNQVGASGNPIVARNTACPLNLSQADGHVYQWCALECALYGTEFHKEALFQWAQYVGCLWMDYQYRYNGGNGMGMPQHVESGRGIGRTLLIAAYAATFADRNGQFKSWVNTFLTNLNNDLQAQPAGTIPILQYSNCVSYNGGTGISPWNCIHIPLTALGLCIKMGFTAAQAPFDYLAEVLYQSQNVVPGGAQHEFSTAYSFQVKDASGALVATWADALKATAAYTGTLEGPYTPAQYAVALNDPENSLQLQTDMGNPTRIYQAGDYFEDLYDPTVATSYPAQLKPPIVLAAKYGTNQTAAQAALKVYNAASRVNFAPNPKYDLIG